MVEGTTTTNSNENENPAIPTLSLTTSVSSLSPTTSSRPSTPTSPPAENYAKNKLKKLSTSLKNAKEKFHSTDSGLDVSCIVELCVYAMT